MLTLSEIESNDCAKGKNNFRQKLIFLMAESYAKYFKIYVYESVKVP